MNEYSFTSSDVPTTISVLKYLLANRESTISNSISSYSSMLDSLMLFIAKELILCNDWIKTIQGTNDS